MQSLDLLSLRNIRPPKELDQTEEALNVMDAKGGTTDVP